MTRLQIAMDTIAAAQAAAIAEAVYDVVHIVEIGTPMILRDGLHPVAALKKKYPRLTVLADTKIVDGGRMECEDACKAGADIITVLALAENTTIKGVVETARKYGRQVMADLIGVEDIENRAGELVTMDVDYICVHTPVDAQNQGRSSLGDLRRLARTIPGERLAVAGGIRQDTLKEYLACSPAIVIVGNALCSAPDVRAAALSMRTMFSG